MTGVKMEDEKTQPTFVISAPQTTSSGEPKKSRLTRKHVLIAVISLVITVLVIVGVLVAIRIYADHDLDALKLQYTMTLKDKDNNDVKQNVSADVDSNVVQYDIERDGVKATILHDFDKGLEISRVEGESGAACYIVALNRSNAQEPTKIPTTAPTPDDKTPSRQLVYTVDDKPIKDTSFMGTRANKLCANVPTHWMVPSCDKGGSVDGANATTPSSTGGRAKRATYCANYYYYGYYYINKYYPCYCGCCAIVCGSFASSYYQYYYMNGYYVCVYRMYFVLLNYGLGYNSCYYNGRWYYYP